VEDCAVCPEDCCPSDAGADAAADGPADASSLPDAPVDAARDGPADVRTADSGTDAAPSVDARVDVALDGPGGRDAMPADAAPDVTEETASGADGDAEIGPTPSHFGIPAARGGCECGLGRVEPANPGWLLASLLCLVARQRRTHTSRQRAG
jgi:hypothetical protein